VALWPTLGVQIRADDSDGHLTAQQSMTKAAKLEARRDLKLVGRAPDVDGLPSTDLISQCLELVA
jgi:hypothetical protein